MIMVPTNDLVITAAHKPGRLLAPHSLFQLFVRGVASSLAELRASAATSVS
jgi:hypothetical protein